MNGAAVQITVQVSICLQQNLLSDLEHSKTLTNYLQKQSVIVQQQLYQNLTKRTNMTSNNTNILENFRDGDKYQQECSLKRGFHGYESINSQQISKNIVETEYICLDCSDLKYVYNYLEDDDDKL